VLDTCGAAVIQLAIYFLTKRAFKRRLALEPEPELTTTR
jgi:hypothetical protein